MSIPWHGSLRLSASCACSARRVFAHAGHLEDVLVRRWLGPGHPNLFVARYGQWSLCPCFLSTRTHQIEKKVSKYRTAFYYIFSVSVVFEKSEVNLKSNLMILRQQQSTYSPRQDLLFPHVRKIFAALEKNLTIFEVWRSSIPGHRLTSTWQRGWWFLGSSSLRRRVPASDAGSHGLHLHAGINFGKVNNGIPESCSCFTLDLKATEGSVKRSCG